LFQVPPETTLSICSSASGSSRYLADTALSTAAQSRTESLCEEPKETADIKIPESESKPSAESELSEDSGPTNREPGTGEPCTVEPDTGETASNIQSQVTTRTGTPESLHPIPDPENMEARTEAQPNGEQELDDTHLPLLDAVLNYINSAVSFFSLMPSRLSSATWNPLWKVITRFLMESEIIY